MKLIKYVALPTVFLSVLIPSALIAGEVISINIGGSTDNTRVLTEFGVSDYGTVLGNWNNIGFDFANPVFEDGTESTLLVETVFPWGTDDDNGFPRTYGPGTIGTPLHHGPNVYPATPDVQLTFSNLRANFPDGFYVIAYLTGYASTDGGAHNEGSVDDGRTFFYWKNPFDLSVQVTPETLIQTTTVENPGQGNFPTAHYAVFGSKEFPKISDVYTLTVQSYRRAVSIGGVQIISATYEPTADNTWAGFTIDENGWVDTGIGFMGLLATTADANFVYSFNAHQFLYAEEGMVMAGSGAWIYVQDEAALLPENISGNWYGSGAFGSWVYSPGADVGTGAGWVYVLDLYTSN